MIMIGVLLSCPCHVMKIQTVITLRHSWYYVLANNYTQTLFTDCTASLIDCNISYRTFWVIFLRNSPPPFFSCNFLIFSMNTAFDTNTLNRFWSGDGFCNSRGEIETHSYGHQIKWFVCCSMSVLVNCNSLNVKHFIRVFSCVKSQHSSLSSTQTQLTKYQ